MSDTIASYRPQFYSLNPSDMDTILEEKSRPSRGILSKIDPTKLFIALAFLALMGCIFFVMYRLEVEVTYYIATVWILCVLLLLWGGNALIARQLNARYDWAARPSKRFFIQLSLSAFYSLLCVNGTYYLFKIWFTDYPPDVQQFATLNVYGLLFIIPVISINFGVYFLMQWKKAFVQSEHLKQEHLKTQFESLKNHIDPHFLFNNLNILSSLIGKENQDAQEFLDSFSDVYRYVLQNKGAELVKVEKELEFMTAYFHMLSKRFKGSLSIDTNVGQLSRKKYLPPLSLQILLENIVKHNVIDANNPLRVEVAVENDKYLVIKNNLRKKKLHTYSSHSGLKNISKRYNYLSDEVIQVVDDGQSFTVKLPLLTMDWV